MSETKGVLHPLTQVMNDCYRIMNDMGFQFVDGPELEDEWHNFDALNVPADHPARDMQDTFWLKQSPQRLFTRSDSQESNIGLKGRPVMRTHTSSVQIRYMEELIKSGGKPPFQIFSLGKTFRNERTDATHEAQFHQFEGLAVGEGISMAHLKGTLTTFFSQFYGESVELRMRPAFFPFVEPGVEIDVKRGNGKWLELMGAGMVHPNVLENVGIDSTKYSGFAFGGGVDRLAMIKYGIPDVRMFYNGDLRVINQFK